MKADESFWQIVGPEVGWLYRQLRRLGVRAPDLEDVCQDVLVQLVRRWEQYDRKRKIRPWLFGFAFRVTADYRKRARRRGGETSLDVEPASSEPGPYSALEKDRARAAALRALDAMSPVRRAVLVLADLEDTPVPEIAEALGIPLNTAYSRLRLARLDFAEAARREHERAPDAVLPRSDPTDRPRMPTTLGATKEPTEDLGPMLVSPGGPKAR